MVKDDVAGVMEVLLQAPAEAVVGAASQQRKVWADWLRDVLGLLEGVEDATNQGRLIEAHLRLAPVWRLAAQVSVGLTMRVASIERFEAGVKLGLSVSAVQASGSFGWMNESANESVLQARAQYALTNDQSITLGEYLAALGIDSVATPEQVSRAIERLDSATSTGMISMDTE